MDFGYWLLRIALWIRRPPTRRWFIAAGIGLGFALTLFGIEQIFGWPDFLRADHIRRLPSR